MIPLMEREVVERRGWLTEEQFLQQVSLAQAMPGVFAVNMATAIGYRYRGLPGAVAAIVGAVAMPIVMILLLAMFFNHFRGNETIERLFMGIRPAVVALISAPVFNMAKAAHISWSNCWIPVTAALLIWLLHVSPILIILLSGLAGFAYGRYQNYRHSKS